MNMFLASREAALGALERVSPDRYAQTRNFLDGAVSRLSPYLTHGILDLREVYLGVHARQPLDVQHKFVFELGWRAYYRHVWSHLGDGIFQSLHAGVLPDSAYRREMPPDVLHARTGIQAIDLAVRTLYSTGYLHNHARMWLASYLVHLRKVHWQVGAHWMLGYLLDGDCASNSMSWQWVAGTSSVKPYVFNAENVAKFAPPQWHSFGSVLDASYEVQGARAHSLDVMENRADELGDAVEMSPPLLQNSPQEAAWRPPDAAVVHGRDVWLCHPWSLVGFRGPVDAMPVSIGIGVASSHLEMPWSARRWQFVTDGLRAKTDQLWWGNVSQLAQALQGARSVQWQAEPHINPAMEQLQALLHAQSHVQLRAPVNPPELFAPVGSYCQSFAQWWRKTELLDVPTAVRAR